MLAVSGLPHNAVITVEFSQATFGDMSVSECLSTLVETVDAVHDGSLQHAEALLTGQAVALNAIFASMARRAAMNASEYLDATDRYMRLALKAQAQCRATVDSLASLKRPATVFAQQANIAGGPQQVNNAINPRQAMVPEESDDERMDARTSRPSGTGDSTLAAVAILNRTADN